jgi:uncharacterized protein (TIGR03000 family)
MYTLVLMSAMGTAPDSAQFNGFFRELFSFRGGCSGSDDRSTSRDTGGCSGCRGGLFHGGIRNWLSGCHGSCTGCCGGTGRAIAPARVGGGNGYGGTGCSGSVAADRGYSCTGGGCTGYAAASCFGSMPGSCFGTPGVGGYGTPIPDGFGMPGGGGIQNIPNDFAQPVPVPSYFNPFPGDTDPIGPPTIMSPPSGFDSYPLVPISPASPSVGEERSGMSVLRPTNRDSQRGTVIVTLPPDAKLFAEGRPLSQTAGERKFVTPPLPSDREAVYTFRVEYVRDGRVLSESQKIQVRAGGAVSVDFADLTTARPNAKLAESYATGKGSQPTPTIVPPETTKPLLPPVTTKPPVPQDRAKIVVKLPPGATLFVDGRRNERSDAVREFTTPVLSPGKEYAYLMKAEWRRDGRPETQEQRIEFRGGEQLTVDFTTGPNGTARASR